MLDVSKSGFCDPFRSPYARAIAVPVERMETTETVFTIDRPRLPRRPSGRLHGCKARGLRGRGAFDQSFRRGARGMCRSISNKDMQARAPSHLLAPSRAQNGILIGLRVPLKMPALPHDAQRCVVRTGCREPVENGHATGVDRWHAG
jgi:hypothetical protein